MESHSDLQKLVRTAWLEEAQAPFIQAPKPSGESW